MGPTRHFLLRISSPQGSRIYHLPPGETLIGSSPSADVFLPDARVTAAHARILLSGDEIKLTDLGSRNGTYVSKFRTASQTAPAPEVDNPLRLKPQLDFLLVVGDRVQIGLAELWLDEDANPVRHRVAPSPAVVAGPVRPAWYAGAIPPGLSNRSLRLLSFLPEIYRSGAVAEGFQQHSVIDPAPPANFTERLLALFESVLLPIEWLVDNFDFYLDPRTTPDEFLPWLEDWFGLEFAASLDPTRRRKLLCYAHRLFRLKGTRTALIEVLELVTGCTVEVDDLTTGGAHFVVTVQCSEANLVDRTLLEQLIVALKPIHTTHQLVIAMSA